jgi:hypothetical protein
MTDGPTPGSTLSLRALNRATLARQLLLERAAMSVVDALERLVGMQAQTPHTAYVGLWDRLIDFRPEDLSDRLEDRSVVRMALMRSTIHLVAARDAWGLRPLVQPVLDRMQRGQFGRRLDGVDVEAVVAMGRVFVAERPRTFRELGDHLLTRWPDRDRLALEQAVRAGVPLVQVPPRGLWGRSGPIAHTSADAWLGAPPAALPTIDAMVLRYLGAFGPASVMDAQAWCGLTRLDEVFARLRPGLIVFRADTGRELFDLPDAPRPDRDTPAPPRFLYDFENLLLSHADRSRAIAPDLARGLTSRTQESISTFTLDGFVAGTWGVERRGGAATLVIRPLRRVSKRDAAALGDEGAGLLALVAAGATAHDVVIADPRDPRDS